jgi:hypothetical protein
VTLIDDQIGQGGFIKVYIASVIDNTCNEPKVIVKIPFQAKKNELKNEAEMVEIIRKNYHDVDKAN